MIISEKRRMEVNESGGLQRYLFNERRLDLTRTLRKPGSKPLPEQQRPQIDQLPKKPPKKPRTILQIITILLVVSSIVFLGINYISRNVGVQKVSINRLQEIKGEYYSYMEGESDELRMRSFREELPDISQEEWKEFLKYIGEDMSCYLKEEKIHCEADL